MGRLRGEYVNLLRQDDVALPLRDIRRPPPQEDERSLADVQEYIRHVEVQRVYMSYKDVGTELVANLHVQARHRATSRARISVR